MTLSIAAAWRQSGAGTPLELRASIVRHMGDVVANDIWTLIGVTTTPTPPTTFASFAHVENPSLDAGGGAPLWDSEAIDTPVSFAGGVQNANQTTIQQALVKRLDSNWVAGRYAWYAWFDKSTAPSGSDAVAGRAGGYLIQ